ncbi:MAG: hypothetical protein SGARI_001201, partial [Bacillariaceae sp.]
SLGSYTDKKSVLDTNLSLSKSVHGRKTIKNDFDFRKPAFQGTATLGDNKSTEFDPFLEEEEADLVDSPEKVPSKPSSFSQIDLLEIPSDHIASGKTKASPDPTQELVDHVSKSISDDPFGATGHSSFGSIDSMGKPRKSSKKASKDKGGTSKSSRKSTLRDRERSTRKSRTVDGAAEGSKRTSRTIGGRNAVARTKSDLVSSNHGKRTRNRTTTTGINRSKSMDTGGGGGGAFDFETPSFGFGGSNVFQDSKSTAKTASSSDDDNDDPFQVVVETTKTPSPTIKKQIETNSSKVDDVFDLWAEETEPSTTTTPRALAPSKKEKRPPKINEATEEEDFFPDAPPLSFEAGFKPPTRVDSGGGGNSAAANRAKRYVATNAAISTVNLNGWTQEMPGCIASTTAVQPVKENEESENDDDDSGFELELPGSGGDLSPLTAYTRAPVSFARRR